MSLTFFSRLASSRRITRPRWVRSTIVVGLALAVSACAYDSPHYRSHGGYSTYQPGYYGPGPFYRGSYGPGPVYRGHYSPAPTGGHMPGTAKRNSAAARKYAGTISKHANGLNGSAFMRLTGTAMPYQDSRAPTIIEAEPLGRGISISGIGERPDFVSDNAPSTALDNW